MNIDNAVLMSLLDGSATDEQKAFIRERLEQEDNSFIIAHSHRGGTTICRVILDPGVDRDHIKRLLCSCDSSQFEFHSDPDEYIDGIETESEMGTFDLRGVKVLSDDALIADHGGIESLVAEFAPLDDGSSIAPG